MVFLYDNYKLPDKEMMKTISIARASERIKYLGINSAKEVRTYTENDKVSRKEIKEDRHKQKDVPCLWTEGQYCYNALTTQSDLQS